MRAVAAGAEGRAAARAECFEIFSQSPACRGTARCAPRVKADRERVSEFSEGEGADSFCGAENLKISNFGREITWDGNPLRLIA